MRFEFEARNEEESKAKPAPTGVGAPRRLVDERRRIGQKSLFPFGLRRQQRRPLDLFNRLLIVDDH